MRKLFIIALVLALPAACTATTWSDDFESYALDSLLAGQGGWAGWDGGACAAIAGDDQAIGSQAAELFVYDDLVQEFTGIGGGGQAKFVAWQYLPDDNYGVEGMNTFFILMNNYNFDPGPKGWSVQLNFDLTNGLLQDDMTAAVEDMPIVFNQWVEIKIDIDFDLNTYDAYYGGNVLSTGTRYMNPDDANNKLKLAALDLWADAGVPVYYDNLKAVPEPSVLLLAGLGLLAVIRRKK